MACGPSQLYEPVKVRYPFQEPGNDDAEAVSDRDPDYRIDERNPIEILQEYMGINNMGQIPGDFFKEHDTKDLLPRNMSAFLTPSETLWRENHQRQVQKTKDVLRNRKQS